ncbi:LysR family hydrogen peroxide-inducible transcriptional activator [Roseibium hamelinense]|uniref:LysR family hydrogen peroxide-inducible transcriptional activator n=1 Tax=Roseibium hamelinense TaxID=150831 RepID=A0A562TIZ2_9HYPH|nr:LysR substrate-binding domain-containing protein [Roseibium hamelinense]MTI45621.1 LysR family transcriptional regulator [Roseibium hamelinense]TWI93198.1 LysR family hydrogen peroxide-inducible transcriptional activator [Roseibium hamelinense]
MSFRPSARQLEYFLALSETGHFGRAAERCNVSQPTLSSQFKLLEDQLGVALLDRGAGDISLTPAGEALLPLAHQAIETLDEIVAAANARIGNLGGLVRLGVAPTFGPYFMPHILPRLKDTFPDLELYIREERPAQLLPDLQTGALDCVLCPAPLASDRVESEIICSEELLLAVPSDHPLAGLSSVPLDALRGERLLTLGRGHRLYEDGQLLAQQSGAVFRADYEGTSLDALRQMVSIGMGLALFPAGYIASEFGKETRVLLKSIDGFAMKRDIALGWRKASARRPHYQIILDISRRTAADMAVPGIRAAAR